MTKVWHPLSSCNNKGHMIDRADGVYLYDSFSKSFFDANSGLWNVNLGYNNEVIKSAVIDQLERLPFVNPLYFYTEAAEKLAEKLCSMISKNMTKVVFSCTGSEAIEVAIKLIRKYNNLKHTPPKKIAVFGNSYHGSYYGSMSASYFEGEHRLDYAPLLDGFVSLGIPYIRVKKSYSRSDAEKQLILQLNEWLDKNGKDICAVIIEPIIGSGGVIVPSKKYMNNLMEYCKKSNILVVCDEIACGFGRCGKLFGFQYYGIQPDIVTLSKGLNNGYLPIGATCVSKKIIDAFHAKDEILFHLSTQNLNPLTMTAAMATLNQYDDTLIETVNKASEFWKQCLNSLQHLDSVYSVRVCGLMIAIDFQDKDGKPLSLNKLLELINCIIENGVIVCDSYIEKVLSAVVMFPPYIASKQDIRWSVSVIKRAIFEILDN